jgi:hypothetical protein
MTPIWYGNHDYDLSFHAHKDVIVNMMDTTNACMYIEKIGKHTSGLEDLTPKPKKAPSRAYSRVCYSPKHNAAIVGLQYKTIVKENVTATTAAAAPATAFMDLNQVLKPDDAFPNMTFSPHTKSAWGCQRRVHKLASAAA